MLKKATTGICLALSIVWTFAFSFFLPSAQAFESEKIMILISSDPGRISPDSAAKLTNKLATQFKFPKYELLKSTPVHLGNVDTAMLKKLAESSEANGVLILEIKTFQSLIRSDIIREEMVEDTTVDMILHYYSKKTGQAGQLKVNRSISQFMGPDSGSEYVALGLIDVLLDKLDSIFPRQFSGPRY